MTFYNENHLQWKFKISLTLLRSKFENLLFSDLHNMCGLSLNSMDCFVIDITGNRYVIPGLD